MKKQAYLGQVAMNHQSKLRKINQEEEKKAMAMISSLDNQFSVIQAQQFY